MKHKVGKSSIPYGQGTPLAKNAIVNELWAARGMRPDADLHLFGHIHDYNYIGNGRWCVMSGHALEWSTKYGSRQCAGSISMGVVEFVFDKGGYRWHSHELKLPEMVVRAEQL